MKQNLQHTSITLHDDLSYIVLYSMNSGTDKHTKIDPPKNDNAKTPFHQVRKLQIHDYIITFKWNYKFIYIHESMTRVFIKTKSHLNTAQHLSVGISKLMFSTMTNSSELLGFTTLFQRHMHAHSSETSQLKILYIHNM